MASRTARPGKHKDNDEELELEAGPWAADGSARTLLESGIEVRLHGAIPGEHHLVRIVHRSRGGPVQWAQSLQLVDSPQGGALRREPPCPLHERCGACGIQHVRDDAQLRLKVHSALPTLGDSLQRVLRPEAEWTSDTPPFGYRHKAVFLPAVSKGSLLLGGFGRGSHSIIDLPDCAVLAPALVQIRDQLQQVLAPVLVERSDLAAAPGTAPTAAPALRAIVARANRRGEVVLCAVVRHQAARRWIETPLRQMVAGKGPLVGASLQVFDGPGDAISGSAATQLVAGLPSITEQLRETQLELQALAFFQVNPFALERLAGLLAANVPDSPDRPLRILDLYCGGGALGLSLAADTGRSAQLSGLDLDDRAITTAREDARRNQIDAEFQAGRAAHLLPELARTRGPFDVVILDPPRRGLRSEAIDEILSVRAPSLLYVSCHSPSLARDAQRLAEAGYRAADLWPIDMLPQTPHLEWLARFRLAE